MPYESYESVRLLKGDTAPAGCPHILTIQKPRSKYRYAYASLVRAQWAAAYLAELGWAVTIQDRS